MKRTSLLITLTVAAAAFAAILIAGNFKNGAGQPVAKGTGTEKAHACSGCGSEKAETTLTKAASLEYPLDTCVISDEKLGSMGAPYAFVHEGTEVQLCCKACLGEFHRSPVTYLEKISAGGGKES